MAKKKSTLSKLANIGPTIERRLNEIGIFTKEDLSRVGPVESYQRIVAANPGVTIPVCYYLYSLEGAINDTHWDHLPEEVKTSLRKAVSRD